MFYDNLENACKSKGITIVTLRKALGIPKTTTASWKTQGTTPRYETLVKIASYLGVSESSLLGTEIIYKEMSMTKCCLCSEECDGTPTSLSLCRKCYKKALAAVEFTGESLVSLDQEDTTISTVIKQGEQPQNNAQDDDDDDNLTSFTL